MLRTAVAPEEQALLSLLGLSFEQKEDAPEMKSEPMVALRTFPYKGKKIPQGEGFSALKKDVKVLELLKMAQLDPAGHPVQRSAPHSRSAVAASVPAPIAAPAATDEPNVAELIERDQRFCAGDQTLELDDDQRAEVAAMEQVARSNEAMSRYFEHQNQRNRKTGRNKR